MESTARMANLQTYILSILQSLDLSVSLGRRECNIIEGELKSFLVVISHSLHKYLLRNTRTCAKISDILCVLKEIYSDTYIYEFNKSQMPRKTYLPLCFAKRTLVDLHPEIHLTKQAVEYLRFVAESYLKQLFGFLLPSLDKKLDAEHLNYALSKMKSLEKSA